MLRWVSFLFIAEYEINPLVEMCRHVFTLFNNRQLYFLPFIPEMFLVRVHNKKVCIPQCIVNEVSVKENILILDDKSD
jgi:hypothetical protein